MNGSDQLQHGFSAQHLRHDFNLSIGFTHLSLESKLCKETENAADNGTMPLIAYVADTGVEVESFTTSTEVWANWRKLPVGSFVIGRNRTPAVLKRSPRGLQFFAAAPGLGGTTAPESVAHQIAKIKLALGMRAAGFDAKVEHSGTSLLGEEWQADVFVNSQSGPMAIEIQLSRQHWDDYRHRTERYKTSGVSVVWLVRGAHWKALSNSTLRHWQSQGLTLDDSMNRCMEDMPCIPLVEASDNEDEPRVIVYPSDQSAPVLRETLENFGAGVAAGALSLGENCFLDGSNPRPSWMWDRTKVALVKPRP